MVYSDIFFRTFIVSFTAAGNELILKKNKNRRSMQLNTKKPKSNRPKPELNVSKSSDNFTCNKRKFSNVTAISECVHLPPGTAINPAGKSFHNISFSVRNRHFKFSMKNHVMSMTVIWMTNGRSNKQRSINMLMLLGVNMYDWNIFIKTQYSVRNVNVLFRWFLLNEDCGTIENRGYNASCWSKSIMPLINLKNNYITSITPFCSSIIFEVNFFRRALYEELSYETSKWTKFNIYIYIYNWKHCTSGLSSHSLLYTIERAPLQFLMEL